METLLEIKETVKNFYEKYDAYLISVFKFLLALCAYMTINIKLGYMQQLNSVLLVLILALFCSFLPLNSIVLIGSALIVGHLYALSLEAFLIGSGLIFILLLLYFGLAPKECMAMILTPIACALNLPCAVPLVMGLTRTPFSGIGIAFGTIGYYSIEVLKHRANGVETQAKDVTEAMMEKITGLLDSILKNPQMVIAVITAMVVLVMVYIIRRMAIRYAWDIAILIGGFIYLLSTLMGQMVLGALDNLFFMILGTAVSIVIAFAVKIFRFQMDYSKVQNVQFEDDDYYYYVKAVPKRKAGQTYKKRPDESERGLQKEGRSINERVGKVRQRGKKRSDIDIQDY